LQFASQGRTGRVMCTRGRGSMPGHATSYQHI
jgi:hypothetical protein